MMEFFIVIGIIWFFAIGRHQLTYNKSEYKDSTGRGFRSVLNDKGAYGEYLTYSELERMSGKKRILTNLLLQKKDGSTTELDVVLINRTGIYVIESKNYSGWIYGNYNYKNWTQTLPNGDKNKFYNPIWQNEAHVNAIVERLTDIRKEYVHSIIVFSNRCELKSVPSMQEVAIIKRYDLVEKLTERYNNNRIIFNEANIDEYAEKLLSLSISDDVQRLRHIERINRIRN